MSERSKKLRDQIPEAERAGTHLSKAARPVYGRDGHGRQAKNGWWDPETLVFQGGGELGEVANLYRDPPCLSLLYDVWKRIVSLGIERWEMRVHEDNTVIIIPMREAALHGFEYRAGEERRWGVALYRCSRFDAHGRRVPVEQPTKWWPRVAKGFRQGKAKAQPEVDPRQGRLFEP